MKKLVAAFVKYPFYANVVILIFVIAGVVGYLNMKKSFFPERSTTEIYVTITYPGASPKEMEEGLTQRIEEAVRSIVGIKEITSTSSENFARVRIETTGEYDIDETLQEVKNAVDGISSFPSAAEKPIVFKQRAVTSAAFMGLSGDVDLMNLKKYAYQIEDDLLSSGVISQVRLGGFPPVEISVEVTEENLLRYNLSFDEISRAIAFNNTDVSAGQIKSDEEEILIRSRKRSVNPKDIEEIIIRANPDGSYLKIKDIGTVEKTFADIPGESFMNGKQSISFNINKLSEEDLSEISKYLNKYVKDFNKKHDDVQLDVTFDFLSVLGSRLNLLYRNGGVGLGLVLLSLGLFLSFRLSFWVAIGIPLSFLGMFFAGSIYGITINMISLFGMILVVGILVDDGIVIAENVYSHFEKGKNLKRAAIDGTMEVLPAVFTSVTTTIIAFLPLFFLEGRMEFMFEMAFVVVFSLLFSMIEAFFVLPGHLGNIHIERSKKRTNIFAKMRYGLDRFIDFMRSRIYAALLRRVIKHKWTFAILPIAFVIITVGLFGGNFIKATFFPPVTFDQINVDLAFKPGEGEGKTEKYMERFEDSVWVVNEEMKQEFKDTNDFIEYTFRSIGGAFSGTETGGHAGNVFILLRDMEGAPLSSFDIATRIRNKIGPIPEAEKFAVGGRQRFGSPVSISLLGKDMKELQAAKVFLENELKNIPTLNNITNNDAAGKREVKIELTPKAYFLGLDHASISKQLRQGFFGDQAQRLQEGKDEIRIWVRYPKSDRLTLGQLESVKIKTPVGNYPLTELVDYHIERGPVNIQRFNGSKEVRVDADLVDPYEPVPPILEQINREIIPVLKTKYPGVEILAQGQARESSQSMANLQKYFGIAFLIIILIIVIHFKSGWQAFMVIFMIPLAWMGSTWGHGLEGIPVSMLSAWGMVALAGVIINDAIVFLAKYNSLLLEGNSVHDAVFKAGLARFRPIVLTTITTTVGLYPIILEKSFQAQFLKPMAISLAYGVLIGTGFILIFFPSIILMVNNVRVWLKWAWTGKRPTQESVESAIINSKRSID